MTKTPDEQFAEAEIMIADLSQWFGEKCPQGAPGLTFMQILWTTAGFLGNSIYAHNMYEEDRETAIAETMDQLTAMIKTRLILAEATHKRYEDLFQWLDPKGVKPPTDTAVDS